MEWCTKQEEVKQDDAPDVVSLLSIYQFSSC